MNARPHMNRLVIPVVMPVLIVVALAFFAGQSPVNAAPDAPGAPASVSVEARNNILIVTWTAPSTAPTGAYIIELFTASNTSTAIRSLSKGPNQTLEVRFIGLTPETSYVVSVKAQNKNSRGGKTAGPAKTATATTAATTAAPGAVTNLKLRQNGSSLIATWDPPTTKPTGPYLAEAFLGSQSNPFSGITLGPNAKSARFAANPSFFPATYKVSVKARNKSKTGGISAFSAATTATTTMKSLPATPGAVTNVRFKNVTHSSLTVEWDAPTAGATNLKEYSVRLLGRDVGYAVVGSKIRGKNASKAHFEGLDPSTRYRATVRARGYIEGVGYSAFSTEARVDTTTKSLPTPPTAPSAPAQPAGLTLSNVTSNSLVAEWTKPTTLPTWKYLIELRKGSTVAQSHSKSPKAAKIKFTGLDSSTAYTVSVKARNKNRVGIATSSEATASTSTKASGSGLPGPPTNLRFSSTTATTTTTFTTTFNWDAPAAYGGPNVTAYFVMVYEKGDSGYDLVGERMVQKGTPSRNESLTLKYCTQYKMRVRAKNSVGVSPWATAWLMDEYTHDGSACPSG